MDRIPRNLSTLLLKVWSPSSPISFPLSRPEGTIFDVSKKVDVYGRGKSYNLFAGKDASKALGMSSLKPEDAVSDYSTLPEDERKVLDDWYSFFEYARHFDASPQYLILPPGNDTTSSARLLICPFRVLAVEALLSE